MIKILVVLAALFSVGCAAQGPMVIKGKFEPVRIWVVKGPLIRVVDTSPLIASNDPLYPLPDDLGN